MLDFTKPVQTKDGRKVVIISTDDTSVVHSQPVVAVIPEKNIAEGYSVQRFYLDGRWTKAHESGNDLQNVPEEETRWVNFYPQGAGAYPDREEADRFQSQSVRRIACMKVTFKRGDGLDTRGDGLDT